MGDVDHAAVAYGHRDVASQRTERRRADVAPRDTDWVTRLSATGHVRDAAVGDLHELMLRAARHQVGRMPEAVGLGAVRRDEVVNSAADEATVSVLSRLTAFEGRSRFTTWAYKFAILHAGVEVRRASWHDREIELPELAERGDAAMSSPEAHAELSELGRAVRDGLAEAVTPHQRRIMLAVLVDGVPIDVLAERLGTNRGALYKTLHDGRQRLRAYLAERGLLAERSGGPASSERGAAPSGSPKEVNP
ncbi:RNA polymerase sigma-70 factor (ECF subfamily) [Agromyces flavus]|uniref:RNA polymerase sigma-70 factor (ECF subfamily) n=1 Tax=Agromyces flavus TaxID=589382 RepID=A0A1H2A1B8_9MICO|nr:sigma-70 family RNA polymerase sigma factor [Agromyces flavus]MCP2367379.1 RNA polymerase sigma-70 factor (ECF subfamily) [Agromyces flavus]SDT39734.1 RNA polymerase sigma-70 factor, ECF subfamily [Agromyces flavus]